MKIIFGILFYFVCFISVNANEVGCLKERWEEIDANTYSQKIDEIHDLDKDGNFYSCDSYLTPSAVEVFLLKLKAATLVGDATEIAEMVRYPLTITSDETFVDKNGHQKHKSFDIKNKNEFIKKYDAIMTLGVKDIIQCSSLNNMFAMPSQGIFMANGELVFSRNFNTKDQVTINIVTIISGDESHKKWLAKHCKDKK